jgi:hypothetical protein
VAARLGQAARAATARLAHEGVLARLEEIYRGLLDRPLAGPALPVRPVVALAGPPAAWLRPEQEALLAAVEEAAGPLITTAWSPGDSSAAALIPAALLAAGPDALAAAAEGMALGTPFVAHAPGDSPLARLARDSGGGVTSPTAAGAGRLLAGLLLDDTARLRMAAAAGRFLAALTGAPFSAPRAAGRAAPAGAGPPPGPAPPAASPGQ